MTVLAKIRNFFKNTFNIIGCFITPACDEYTDVDFNTNRGINTPCSELNKNPNTQNVKR